MMRAGALLGSVGLAVTLLAACSSQPVQAPVIERAPSGAVLPPSPPAGARSDAYYTVRRGDTLFSIALDHGLDYKDLAAWNNIDNPNRIRSGQQLRIKPPAARAGGDGDGASGDLFGAGRGAPLRRVGEPGRSAPRRLSPAPRRRARPDPQRVRRLRRARSYRRLSRASCLTRRRTWRCCNAVTRSRIRRPRLCRCLHPHRRQRRCPHPRPRRRLAGKPDAAAADDEDKVDWGWPVQGKIIAGFSEASNKGLDIAGKLGDPVVAAAPGRVVYSGSGLRGYGKLVIIKHNKTYLSAYAHNSVILVKEGQSVVKGQKIAEVGSTDSDRPELHFEIRKLGKPVDPAKYLPPPP